VHDLRHTTASVLLAAGTHPKVVQDLLGHSTITLTLDTYSHLTEPLHLQAARAMDLVLAYRAPSLMGRSLSSSGRASTEDLIAQPDVPTTSQPAGDSNVCYEPVGS
jgi:hypothetical protein